MDLAVVSAEHNVGGASAVKGAEATAVYQDQSSVLHPGMVEYFNNRMFSDVFIVAPDGRKLSCHQVVLSAGSKKFAAVLEQGILQADKELPVWGVDSDALESVVRCFYTGECNLNAANVVPVMDASQRLEITPLANFCESFISEVLEPCMVCTLLEQAMHFKMEDLTNTVLKYSESCLSELASLDEYLRADLAIVSKLLAHHRSEGAPAVVLKAGWEWLVADVSHNACVQDIAALLPLPDGLRADDLLDRSKAAEHNITWRQPEPTPPPSPKEEKPLVATGSGLPDLSTLVPGTLAHQLVMLQQAGLLGGQLPLNILMGLQNVTGLANLTNALQALSSAAAATDGSAAAVASPAGSANAAILKQLLANLPGAANALGASWNQAQLMSELLSQLTNPSGALGLGGDLAARVAELQQQLQQQQAQANRNNGKKLPSTPKAEEDEAAAVAAANSAAINNAAKRTSNTGRSGGSRGMCQVEGCNTDLCSLRDYHQRYKICEYHLKIPSVMKDGVPQRFCQQCGRFQPLSEFDGNKRSCKARLQRHNDRRRKRLEEEPSGSYPAKRTPRSEDDMAPPPPISPLSAAALQRGGSGVNAAAALSAVAAAASGRNWGSSLPNLQMLAELMSRVGGGTALTVAAAAAASPASQGNGTPTPPPSAAGGTPPPMDSAQFAAIASPDEDQRDAKGEAVEAA